MNSYVSVTHFYLDFFWAVFVLPVSEEAVVEFHSVYAEAFYTVLLQVPLAARYIWYCWGSHSTVVLKLI